MLHFTRPLALALLALLSTLAHGCSDRPDAGPGAGADRLSVVCTTGMIADAARTIAGEHAQVLALMGPGVDPHLYKPTRSDMAALMQADLVFYNGLHLEGKMIDALERAAGAGRRVHAVAESIDPGDLLQPPGLAGNPDPHVWMSPALWSRAVESVRDAFIEADPGHAQAYRASAERYLAELSALNDYAGRVLASVPESARVLVTAHDAFSYFGREFSIEVVGIQGISTESEAGVRDIERIVALLVDRRVGAVFVETTVAERNVRALIAGAGARGHTVVIGGSLFSDAMGAQDTYEGTYIGMIDHNATAIARALGGRAPERGMNGRLARAARP